MKDKISKNLTPFSIFVLFILLGFAGYLFYALRYGAVITDFFAMENHDLRFCDLIMHVEYVGDPKMLYVDRAIGWQGCFPPLSYFLYYALSRMLTRDGAVPGVDVPIDEVSYLYFFILYYSIAVAFLLLYGIRRFEDNGRRAAACFICLLLSVPFYSGGISVANSTLLVMTLLLISLKFRESDSPVYRELALILIAVCAGFKIYPAIFGLFYLTEKRFKEAARLTVYGIVLFFAPFACFGGMNGLTHWISNVKETMGFKDYGRIQSIRGLMYTVASWNGLQDSIPDAVYSLVPILFVLLMLVLAAVSKDRYRRVFFLCAIMTFYPNNAYRYTLTYLSIPFIMLFMEKADTKPNVFIYIETVLFSLVYAMPVVYGKKWRFHISTDIYTYTHVERWTYFFAYLLMIAVVAHEIWERTSNRRNRTSVI